MVYLSLYNKQKLSLAALTCPKYSRYVSLDKQDYKIRHSDIVVSPCEIEMERDEGDVKEYTFFRCHDKTNTLP